MADAVGKQIREIFAAMAGQLDVDVARGMDAVIQFDITGEGGGQWHAVIRDDQCTVSEGQHERPNMTMTISAEDYIDTIVGKLNGQMAFMSGKLKIAGDMGLAMKMQSLFKTAM